MEVEILKKIKIHMKRLSRLEEKNKIKNTLAPYILEETSSSFEDDILQYILVDEYGCDSLDSIEFINMCPDCCLEGSQCICKINVYSKCPDCYLLKSNCMCEYLKHCVCCGLEHNICKCRTLDKCPTCKLEWKNCTCKF